MGSPSSTSRWLDACSQYCTGPQETPDLGNPTTSSASRRCRRRASGEGFSGPLLCLRGPLPSLCARPPLLKQLSTQLKVAWLTSIAQHKHNTQTHGLCCACACFFVYFYFYPPCFFIKLWEGDEAAAATTTTTRRTVGRTRGTSGLRNAYERLAPKGALVSYASEDDESTTRRRWSLRRREIVVTHQVPRSDIHDRRRVC